jgi:hypothetical protein
VCGDQGGLEAAINRFLTAYNTGDPAAETYIARDGGFEWYSEKPLRMGRRARDRSGLATLLSSDTAKVIG